MYCSHYITYYIKYCGCMLKFFTNGILDQTHTQTGLVYASRFPNVIYGRVRQNPQGTP